MLLIITLIELMYNNKRGAWLVLPHTPLLPCVYTLLIDNVFRDKNVKVITASLCSDNAKSELAISSYIGSLYC